MCVILRHVEVGLQYNLFEECMYVCLYSLMCLSMYCVCARVCVCVSVCVCARARVCVRLCG